MIGAAQQFPLFREGQIPVHKSREILICDLKARPVFDGFHNSICPGCGNPLNRFSLEQHLKLFDIISGKELFLEMPYMVILREILFLSRCPVPLKIISIRKIKKTL